MTTTRTQAIVTQPLPLDWRPVVAPSLPEPRRRYPRNTASLAITQRLKVVR